ncbi:MAG: tetratricopeptide repeat protein, partial [Planctomycetota bacterium]
MTRIARYTPATVQVGLLLAVGMLVGQGGCVGQGKYTSDHATLAQQRLDGIKSATELDMAEQAFLAGDLKKAREKLARVLAMNPSSLRARVLMGRVQLEQGAVGDAAVTLSEAVGLDAGSVDAQYYLGVVLERLHRPGEALDRFRTAAELKPFDPQYAIAAGEAFVDLERVDEARVFLEERPVAQNSPGVRQLLGHIAMIESRPADAAER